MAAVVSVSKVSRGCRERPVSAPASSCMRRQPDCGAAATAALSAPASRRAGGPNLGPGSMLAALSCRGPESKAPSSSPLAAGAAGPPSLAGGLTPMAHHPPAEERLLPNGNVCHFAGCGCADGVSGEIRAALKECVSNMRQQQQMQQQQQQEHRIHQPQQHHGHQSQQQQQSGGQCGCPVLLRGACEHQARPAASSASNNAAPPPAPLKSLLKRASTTRPRRGSRVRFSDTLTVFSEDYPEAQLYVIRTADLTYAEVCAMYEPPPEYRDLPPFEPPDGYRDDAYLLPFLKEARAAAAAARAAAAAAAASQQATQAGIPAASAQVGAQQQQQQPSPQQQHQQHQQGTTPHAPTAPVQIRVVERPPPPPPPPRTTPVATGPAVVGGGAEDRGGGKVEDETQLPPPPTAEILEDLAKKAALEEAQRKGEKDAGTQKRGEEIRIDQERPPAADGKTTTAVVIVSSDGGGGRTTPEDNDVRKVIVVDEEDDDVKRREESSPVLPEDEDDAILLELKKQLECNSSGDIEADLAELLPPGLIVDDVSRKTVDDVNDLKVSRHRPTVEVRPLSFRQPVPVAATTPASPAATTPSTASSTPDERQEDSDSSADSQDTIILMTNEEEKKAEEANEHRSAGGFRHKLLIIGDKSPSDTSSVSSSASQDSDGSLRSSESTTNSEDRTESPTGSSGSSSGGGGGGRGHVVEDDIYNDDLDALLEYGPHSNLQVRRTIERTAMRRSLTRVTDVRKRTPTNLAKSPTSSNDVSLVEKLRWLTSLDDDDDDGCSDDSEAAADHHHHHHHHQGPPPPPPVARRPPPDPGFVQDAGRLLPGYPRGGLNGAFQPRPASFSQLSDACRGSLTMLPVAARDYRMVRRVPGENHPQQNTGAASQRGQPPPPPVRRPAPQGSGGVVSVGNNAKDAPPDELERFVQQDMERTERIRKRYSLSEEDEDPSFGFARRPSVRGIRARFGSSAEIMKDVQQMMQNHPAMNMPGSHLSWSHPVELPPPNHKTPQQVKVMLLPRVAEEDTGRNYGSAGDIATLTRSRRTFQPAPSPVPPPPSSSSLSAGKDERGVPEGACSSPKVSSEPGYQGQQQPKSGIVPAPPPGVPPSMASAGSEATPQPPPPQGVVYYSLNV